VAKEKRRAKKKKGTSAESPPELDPATRRFLLWQPVFVAIPRLLTTLIYAIFGYLSVKEIAGQETVVNFLLNSVVDWKVSEATAWVLVVLLSGTNFATLKLRKSAVKQAGEFRKKYEALIDEHRTSSDLDEYGDSPLDLVK